MKESKYEIVWIESVKRWAVRDNTKPKTNQMVFWSNKKELCEEWLEKNREEPSLFDLEE